MQPLSSRSAAPSAQSAYRHRQLRAALALAVITVAYNLVEGVVSVLLGASDEALALFGFGVDSFVEVISGIGILHMVMRMQRNPVEQRDRFEVTALRVTGVAFFLLAAGLTAGGALSLVTGSTPRTTVPGLVISGVSLLTMWLLVRVKLRVGTALESEAIIADAHCTRACFRLSLVLLASSGVYALTGWGFVDALGSFAIAALALAEGREALQKARARGIACSC